MTFRELLLEGSQIIAQSAKSETAWLDASVLLSQVTKLERGQILARLTEPVPEKDPAENNHFLQKFFSACRRRATGLPIAYIVGAKEFFGRDFLVDQSVLIPRPETEILVEWVLEYARPLPRQLKILDCFTGSGCIAVSLALEMKTKVEACDLSSAALVIANQNSQHQNCVNLVNFRVSDLIEGNQSPYGLFDIITANPPYVPSQESRAALEQGWGEPLMALDGGDDGLDLIRRFLPEARRHLQPDGKLFLEFGDGQSQAILELLERCGFQHCEIRADLSGIDRIVCAG